MTRTRTRTLAALSAAALLVPAATAAAKPDAPGAGGKAKAEAKAKVKKVKTVTFVFKGFYQGDSAVEVAKGNGHVKKLKLAGQTVRLDLSSAKLVVADADGNGVSLDDVKAGDKVLVQVRAPRNATAEAPLSARKLVDLTSPPVDEDEAEDAPPAA